MIKSIKSVFDAIVTKTFGSFILKCKLIFIKIELCLTCFLPPDFLFIVMPTRIRIAAHYISRNDKLSANRYMRLVCDKVPLLSEIFALETDIKISRRTSGSLIENLSSESLRTLISQKATRLNEQAQSFYRIGWIRVGSTFSAAFILRLAINEIVLGKNRGRLYDHLILSISTNDLCISIVNRDDIIDEYVLKKLRRDIEDFNKKSINQKVSIFIDKIPSSFIQRLECFQNSTVLLQGPSNRSTNIEFHNIDFFATIGYSGKNSVVNLHRKVDISLYRDPKFMALSRENRLFTFSEIGFSILSTHEPYNKELVNRIILNYKSIKSPVITKNNSLFIDAGAEFLIIFLIINVKNIFITHFDLFTNTEYPRDYIGTRSCDFGTAKNGLSALDLNTRRAAFALHDPCQQYSVFKAFFNSEVVKFDDKMKSILSEPLSIYVDELELLYGDINK